MFYVHVISEAAAEQLLPGELDRSKIIVLRDYSWQAVIDAVEEILHGCQEGTWEEVSAQLSKRFNWEFESYGERSTRLYLPVLGKPGQHNR